MTWELISHTPKQNKFDKMELLHIVSQQYPHINQKNFYEKWLFNPNFSPT